MDRATRNRLIAVVFFVIYVVVLVAGGLTHHDPSTVSLIGIGVLACGVVTLMCLQRRDKHK